MSVCVACKNPLSVELPPDSDAEDASPSAPSSSSKAPAPAPETVPDDVHLSCGCHFHWDCLLDAYQATECSHCGQTIASTSPDGTQQVVVTLHNEGGLQPDLDILPLLTEEAYLKAYPEERKCRAFLEFCREGDIQAIIEMLQDDSDSDEEEDDADDGDGDAAMREADNTTAPHKSIGVDDLLRYQDPIGEMQSGLHAAVQAQSREVAWLLLLLASNLPLLEIPAEVFQEAEARGFMRGLTEEKADIRGMRDASGRTAEDLAKEVGGVWAAGWIGNGRLAM